MLACVGTKEGYISLYKIDSTGYEKLAHSRGGLSYGAITAIDVSAQIEKVIAAS